MAEKGKTAAKETIEQKGGGFLSNLRLSRAAAIEIAALGLILAVAIILRILPLRWGEYLNEYDPFFWYRISEYIAKNGYGAYLTWHDTMSWYPMGRDIAHSSYPGNPFSAVFIWQVLNAIQLKVSLFDVALYFPVFLATLTCIAAYYFGKDFGGKTAGVFTALFMAINPSYISRTVLGFFDTENIAIFCMVATGLCFLRSIEPDKALARRILYAGAGGLALGYALASWGAARYISSLLLLYIVVMLILGKVEMRHTISYTVTISVGFLIALVIPRLGIPYLMNIENLAAIGAIGLLLVYEVVKTRLSESQARLTTLGLIALALIAFLVLPIFGIGNPITGKFLKVLNPFGETSILYTSVGENKVSSWASIFSDFGVTLFLAVFGAYLTLKEGGDKKIYVILFFFTTIYFSATVVRLSLILSFPASLMAAYALVKILEPLRAIRAPAEQSRSKRRRAKALGMNRGVGVIFILLIFFSFVPHAMNARDVASSPGPLASSGGVPILINGDYPKDWVQALNWLKANTTQDSIVCSWWDYGYWIETMANRTTLADGSTMNQTQIVQLANIMMLPQNESLPILNKYNADYIVVFYTFNPNSPTTEWPFGDNVKWPQMARIAGFNLTNYVTQDQQTGQTSYTQTFLNTTIARLMYGTADQTHFKLVFESQLGWVLIYKVEY